MNTARKLAINARAWSAAIRIVRLRRLSGLSQIDLARICRVTPAAVSDWESAVCLPGALDCLTLAEISPLHECDFWLELSGFKPEAIAMLSFLKPSVARRAA